MVLTLLAILNLVLLRTFRSSLAKRAFGRLPVYVLLQLVQFLLSTILTTLFASDGFRSNVRTCLLDTRWQALFSAHDGDAIRRVQDTFNCCGLNSVRDRAWPFSRGDSDSPQVTCAAYYRRALACREPWEAAMRRDAGLEVLVAVAMMVIQLGPLLALAMSRAEANRHEGDAPEGRGWRSWASRLGLMGPGTAMAVGTAQPLLGDAHSGQIYDVGVESDGGSSDGEDAGPSRKPRNGKHGVGEPAIDEDPWANPSPSVD